MFNGHKMILITDLEQIGYSINDPNIVIIAVTDSDYYKLPNIYDAAILMPPTSILMEWAENNNRRILETAYPQYLCSVKEADDMIVAMIVALTKKDVYLYIPANEFSIFGQILLNHLYFLYGVILQTSNTQFNVEISKLPLIVSKMYMLGAIAPNDYISIYSEYNLALPSFVIPKLINDFRPPISTYDIMSCEKYFNDMIIASRNRKNGIPIVESLKEGE